MNVTYYLKRVNDLVIPSRANPTDAGYDITATSTPKIVGLESGAGYHSIDYVEYETNLYFVPQSVESLHAHTDVRPRSSISAKTNFVLANSFGLIDRGYHHQVLLRFRYIWQPADLRLDPEGSQTRGGGIVGTPNVAKFYQKGEKIAQLLPMLTHDISFQLVDELPGDNRGGGFGSTDKPKSSGWRS